MNLAEWEDEFAENIPYKVVDEVGGMYFKNELCHTFGGDSPFKVEQASMKEVTYTLNINGVTVSPEVLRSVKASLLQQLMIFTTNNLIELAESTSGATVLPEISDFNDFLGLFDSLIDTNGYGSGMICSMNWLHDFKKKHSLQYGNEFVLISEIERRYYSNYRFYTGARLVSPPKLVNRIVVFTQPNSFVVSKPSIRVVGNSIEASIHIDLEHNEFKIFKV